MLRKFCLIGRTHVIIAALTQVPHRLNEDITKPMKAARSIIVTSERIYNRNAEVKEKNIWNERLFNRYICEIYY